MPSNKWTDMELVPTVGMESWHQYDATSLADDGFVPDFSENGRDLIAASNPPVLQTNVFKRQPAWYFDGTNDPLIDAVASGPAPPGITIKHVFILAAFEDAVFTGYQGLLSDTTGITVLATDNTGTKFFDLSGSYTAMSYRKSNVFYDDGNMQAPMNGRFALIEVSFGAAGAGMDGLQVGQQTNDPARLFKGWFVDMLTYNRVLTPNERLAVMMYYNLRYSLWNNGTESLDLYFPDDNIVGFRRNRFYAQPPNWDKITDSFEYEDGGKDFAEVASNAPRRWEYGWTGRTPEQVSIFDEFYDEARRANPFKFRDKYGVTWIDTRVEDYSRTHDAHKSWTVNASFNLVNYSGENLPAPDETPPSVPTGLALAVLGSTSIRATWEAAADVYAPAEADTIIDDGGDILTDG